MAAYKLAIASAIAFIGVVAVPQTSAAASASADLILDNDNNCQPDSAAPTPIGKVSVKQRDGKIKISASFIMWGGLEDEGYTLAIAVHPHDTSCHAGEPRTIRNSHFRTNDVGTAKKSVMVKDPSETFHIEVCNDDGDDCSFAGNFVYHGNKVSVDEAAAGTDRGAAGDKPARRKG